MNHQHVRLIDMHQKMVAQGQIAAVGDHFGGLIDLGSTPEPIRALFDEFEEIVNGQMFGLLDAIQAKIQTLNLKVVLDDGRELRIKTCKSIPAPASVPCKRLIRPLRAMPSPCRSSKPRQSFPAARPRGEIGARSGSCPHLP